MNFDISTLTPAFSWAWPATQLLIGYTVLRTLVVLILRWLGAFPPSSYAPLCLIPWRPVARQWLRIKGWWNERHHGIKATAGLAGEIECTTRLYRKGMTYVGRLRWRGIPLLMPVGVKGISILILGKARSGKSAPMVTRLTEFSGNCLVLDIDGTYTHVLAHRWGEGEGAVIGLGKKFRVLDFNGILRGRFVSASWNFFLDMAAAVVRDGINAAVRWADKGANALIVEDNPAQPYFAQVSRSIVKAFILWVFVKETDKSLPRLRSLIARGLPELTPPGKDSHDTLFAAMEATTEFDGIIARGGAMARQGKTKDGRNMSLSTALSQTAWLDDPGLAALLRNSDFSVAELKTGNLALSIVAPVNELKTRLGPLCRLLIGSALYAAETIPTTPSQHKALYVLDEFCALGMEELQWIPSVYPKYGIVAAFLAQEASQIEGAFGKNSETFFNNVDTILVVATEAESTLEWAYKRLGQRTQRIKVAPDANGRSARDEYRLVDTMTKDDLRRWLSVEKNNVMVFVAGGRAMKLKNVPYFRESAVWQAGADPQYAEPWQRQRIRKLTSDILASSSEAGHTSTKRNS